MNKIRSVLNSLRSDWRTLRLAWRVSSASHAAKDARPVIFFNASTRIRGHSQNAAFSLLTAWTVRLAGTPVIHFVSDHGMSRCMQGTDERDVYKPMPCRLCVYQSRLDYAFSRAEYFKYHEDARLAGLLARLDITELSDFAYPIEDTVIPLGALVLPSMRWRFRRMTLVDDEPTRFLYRQFILSAWNVLNEFKALVERSNPQAVVIFNGQTFPEAVVRWLADRRGLRVLTHEVSMYPLSAFFTAGEATALPMPIPPGFELDEQQNARLDALMQARFQGKVGMAGIQFFPEMKGLDEDFQQKAASFKQVVPIFTNVIFDTTQQHSNIFFPDMFTWLDALLEVIRGHPDTLFVLRAHPDEVRAGKTSQESVAMWVEKTRAAGLPNLAFVDAGEYISSYELIRRSKFVLIYNSTVGLEASIMGKPVLSAGRSRFSSFDTTYFPADQQAYLAQLDDFLAAAEVPVLPQHIRNSRRFFYFHYYLASLSFGDFIEPVPPRGYVRFKPFSLKSLSDSATAKALLDGILQGGDFVLK